MSFILLFLLVALIYYSGILALIVYLWPLWLAIGVGFFVLYLYLYATHPDLR